MGVGRGCPKEAKNQRLQRDAAVATHISRPARRTSSANHTSEERKHEAREGAGGRRRRETNKEHSAPLPSKTTAKRRVMAMVMGEGGGEGEGPNDGSNGRMRLIASHHDSDGSRSRSESKARTLPSFFSPTSRRDATARRMVWRGKRGRLALPSVCACVGRREQRYRSTTAPLLFESSFLLGCLFNARACGRGGAWSLRCLHFSVSLSCSVRRCMRASVHLMGEKNVSRWSRTQRRRCCEAVASADVSGGADRNTGREKGKAVRAERGEGVERS